MSTAMMSAPSRASVMAWLRPWPRAAPVMKATLPSTRPVIVLSSLSLCVCCVQHVVLVLAGFRTKAGERVARSARFVVAGPGVGKPGDGVSVRGGDRADAPRGAPHSAVDQLPDPGGGYRHGRGFHGPAPVLFQAGSLGRLLREIRLQVDRAAGFEAPAGCEGADVHRVVAEGVKQLGDLGLGGGVIAGDGQGA